MSAVALTAALRRPGRRRRAARAPALLRPGHVAETAGDLKARAQRAPGRARGRVGGRGQHQHAPPRGRSSWLPEAADRPTRRPRRTLDRSASARSRAPAPGSPRHRSRRRAGHGRSARRPGRARPCSAGGLPAAAAHSLPLARARAPVTRRRARHGQALRSPRRRARRARQAAACRSRRAAAARADRRRGPARASGCGRPRCRADRARDRRGRRPRGPRVRVPEASLPRPPPAAFIERTA